MSVERQNEHVYLIRASAWSFNHLSQIGGKAGWCQIAAFANLAVGRE